MAAAGSLTRVLSALAATLVLGASCAHALIANFSYAENPAVYRVGQLAAANGPGVDGVFASIHIHPPLPAGLTFNGASGVIEGTPTAVSPLRSYTVWTLGNDSQVSHSYQLWLAVESDATLETRIKEVESDSQLALEVSFITLTGSLLFAVIGMLIFFAWRSRKERGTPPMLISDAVVDKISRIIRTARPPKAAAPSEDQDAHTTDDGATLQRRMSGGAVDTSAAMDIFTMRASAPRNYAAALEQGDEPQTRSRDRSNSNVVELAQLAENASKDRSAVEKTHGGIRPGESSAPSPKAAKNLKELGKMLGIEREIRALVQEGITIDQLPLISHDELAEYVRDEEAREKLQSYISRMERKTAS